MVRRNGTAAEVDSHLEVTLLVAHHTGGPHRLGAHNPEGFGFGQNAATDGQGFDILALLAQALRADELSGES